MRKLRVLVLLHEDLVPPESVEEFTEEQIDEWRTEWNVITGLRDLGHEVLPLGVSDDLSKIRRAILDFKPHIAFNLLEEFHGVGVYDQNVVSFLELMRLPYTGCNPRGLLLARDKSLSKQILTYHRIATPRFGVAERKRKFRLPRRLTYPLLVKSVTEDASLGISEASVVRDEAQLVDRIRHIHDDVGTDALVEQFIEGRELYVGVMGNQRLQTFPIWEMLFTKAPAGTQVIATRRAKWDLKHQTQLGVVTQAAKDLPPGADVAIAKLCKRVYRSLYLSGYARLDLRLAPSGIPYVLEANPNPNLTYGEDFAESAEAVGVEYLELLQRILSLGLNYKAAWRSVGA